MDWIRVISLTGAGLYILAYLMLQLGTLSARSLPYLFLNIAGASLVLIGLAFEFTSGNIGSVVIQLAWIVISLIGIYAALTYGRGIKFETREHRFLNSKVRELATPLARKLFSAGTWHQLPAGTTVAIQGEPIGRLMFMTDGNGTVQVDGRQVATVRPDCFIGEITCLSREPATATVTLDAPSELFYIEWAALDGLFRRHPEIRVALQHSFAEETATRLKAMNASPQAQPQPLAIN